MTEQTTMERALPKSPAPRPALASGTAAVTAALRPEIQPWEEDLWPDNECIPDDEMDCEC
jgi:hypothetical protein